MPLRMLRCHVKITDFTLIIFNISSAGYTCWAFTKLKNLSNIGFQNWTYMWFYTDWFIFWRNILWRVLKTAFPRLNISKISGGACHQTPLEACTFSVRFCEHHLKDPLSLTVMLCALFVVKRGHWPEQPLLDQFWSKHASNLYLDMAGYRDWNFWRYSRFAAKGWFCKCVWFPFGRKWKQKERRWWRDT